MNNNEEQDDDYYLDKMLKNKKIKYVFYIPFLLILIFIFFLMRFVLTEVEKQENIEGQKNIIINYLEKENKISSDKIKSIIASTYDSNELVFQIILSNDKNIEYTLIVINDKVYQKNAREIDCITNCDNLESKIAPIKK